jgi:(S)-mandelate dehydrogenase
LSFDSDLRSREYALKALFCGADFVFFGRILQYDKIAAGNPRLEQL